jgi:hypothetical protein
MTPNNLPKREEYLRKKRKKRIIRYSTSIFFVLLIIGIFSYISHRKEFRIVKVELSGGILVTQDEVSIKSLEYMRGSYFLLFPKDNAFWYPKSELENYLKESFKRIDAINIKRKDFNIISIEISERKPFAMWCDTPPIEEVSLVGEVYMEDGSQTENCYFIDQNSTIFAKAPHFSGDAYFKYYGFSMRDNPIGLEYIPSASKFAEISNFVEAIKKLSIRPLYLVAKENDQFSIVLLGGGKIYFDTKEPLSKTAENLSILLTSNDLSTSTTGILPVDYIDLRFGNKLFYKLK